MTVDPLTPKQLAELALEVQPHLELFLRAAPHLKDIRPIVPVLERWEEIERDLEWAASAPDHIRAAAFGAVWSNLERKYSTPAAVWGALANIIRSNSKMPAEAPRPAPARNPDEPKVRLRGPKKPAHEIKRVKKHDPATDFPGAITSLEQIKVAMRGIGLPNKEILQRLDDLGAPVHHTKLSGFRTGNAIELVDRYGVLPMSAKRLRDVAAAMELIANELNGPPQKTEQPHQTAS